MTVEEVLGGKVFKLDDQKRSRKYVKLATFYQLQTGVFVNSLVSESGKLLMLPPDSGVILCE